VAGSAVITVVQAEATQAQVYLAKEELRKVGLQLENLQCQVPCYLEELEEAAHLAILVWNMADMVEMVAE